MTPPPPIPEEAVERAAKALWDNGYGVSDVANSRAARAVLQASGALFLSPEERESLLKFLHLTHHIGYTTEEIDALDAARQKLEESLNG